MWKTYELSAECINLCHQIIGINTHRVNNPTNLTLEMTYTTNAQNNEIKTLLIPYERHWRLRECRIAMQF